MSKLPSFLCIGTQKAGTTWLYQQLRQHPNVWMPPIKELHYFDYLYCEPNRSWSKWHIKKGATQIFKHHIDHSKSIDFNYIRYISTLASEPMFTEQWYKQAFKRPDAKGKILGDITPEYCQIGDEGIAYAKHLLGDVKILWIIRDPLERALSQLRMTAERRGFNTRLGKWQGILKSQFGIKTGRSGLITDIPLSVWMEIASAPDIFSRGNYLDYIPRWEQQFDNNRLLFMPFKQIAEQPKELLATVEAFIGVDNWDGYKSPTKKIHATRDFDIPIEVKSYLLEQFQPQYDFLKDHFDTEFIKAI